MNKKTMSLLMVIFLTALPALAEMRGGIGELYLPNESGQETVVPLIVENFPTGTTDHVASMNPVLNDIKNRLMANPNAYGILQGTVSDLHINNGCYVDPSNPAYFSLRSGPQHIVGSNASETDRMCNAHLATARAWNIRNWLVSQGVKPNQLIIYDFPVESKLSESNHPNQSVAVLIVYNQAGSCSQGECRPPKVNVNLPPNCDQTQTENTVNGTLVITVNVTCQEPEAQQSSIPPDQDDQQCHWYHQYPCWSRGEKGLFWGAVGVGAAAAVLSSTCIEIGGGGGGDNGGGDGGGIRIGGNCH